MIELTETTINQLNQITQLLYKFNAFNQPTWNKYNSTHTISTSLITVPLNIPDLHILLDTHNSFYKQTIDTLMELMNRIQRYIVLQQYKCAVDYLVILRYVWHNTELWHDIDSIDTLIQLYINHTKLSNAVEEPIEDHSTGAPNTAHCKIDQTERCDSAISHTGPHITESTHYYVVHYICNTLAICYYGLDDYNSTIDVLYHCIHAKLQLIDLQQQSACTITPSHTGTESKNNSAESSNEHKAADVLDLCMDIDAITYNALGHVLRHIPSYTTVSLNCYTTALYISVICEPTQSGHNKSLVPYLNNIGCILVDQHQYNLALLYYQSAESILYKSNILIYDVQLQLIHHNLQLIRSVTTHVVESTLLQQLTQLQLKHQQLIHKLIVHAQRTKRAVKDLPVMNLQCDTRYFVQAKMMKSTHVQRKLKLKNIPKQFEHNKLMSPQLPLRSFIVEPSEFKQLQLQFPPPVKSKLKKIK